MRPGRALPLGVLLAAIAAFAQAPPRTSIEILPTPLHTQVKRFGINLSGQSFYDSGQMLRNLTFRNPGFEGERWESILRCKAVTATTCTDQNQYSVWPAGFLNKAHFEVLSGKLRGASGMVHASTAAQDNDGVTLTLDRAPEKNAFVLVTLDKPGTPEAGWWPNLQGGASLAVETHDLSPHTPGRQALRLNAAGPGQNAAISSYFDSYNGRSFLQLHTTLTLTFRAKLLAGEPHVAVQLVRLDTTHGGHTFFRQDVPLTSAWRDFTFQIPAHDVPGAVGTVGLTFTFAGTAALLDDVALTAPAARDNPTAFRDEVVETLRDLHPGVLRYMDNGTDFGASLDLMLAPPFARQRAGSSSRAKLAEDIPMGLHEFLTLAEAVGAEPWYTLPPGTSPADAQHLVEYLAGPSTSPYGAIRSRLGHPAPWTETFAQIHVELGNEQWNYGSFAGSTLNDPTAYGERAGEVFAAIRHAPGFAPTRFDLVLGSWATVPWWTQQEIASSSGFDSVALAPYLFNDFQDASSLERVFGPMFAEPEAVDSRPDGYMAQQARTLKPGRHLALYEVNLGALTGSASLSEQNLQQATASLGSGLAVADHMLLALRDLGISTQCLFALPEYWNNFTAPGPHRMVPLWGSVIDMGGPTNLRRPQFLAEKLANQAILPTMLDTRVTGANPTWNQPATANNKAAIASAHLLQTFAFADGLRHSLILLNLSRTDALPVTFTGALSPSGSVDEIRLNSPAISDTNEAAANVRLTPTHLSTFNPAAEYTLPAHSMTVLTWQAAR